MSRSLNRAQLCLFTSWVENRCRSSSSTTTFLYFPFTRFRHSSNRHSKTPKIPLASNHVNFEKKINKDRAKIHEMVRKNWKDVEILTCRSSAGPGGVCDVYLVGTVHISQDSCEKVKEIIKILRPEPPTMGEMIAKLMKQPNIFAALVGWFYAKHARELKVIPDSEFRVAYEEAIKYGGKVVLGDRSVQITMMRVWRKMSLWEKTKLLFPFAFPLVVPEFFELKKMESDTDVLALQSEMSKNFPSLVKTLVHERDQYMSFALFKWACKSRSVVAIVGKGHLRGIKKHWKQPIVLKDLLTIPPRKAVSLTSVVLAGVAVVSGIYLSSKI